ncbi:MAG: AAA family ATPase, partial [Patescibacteria group bacterium]|nr:AAA family ATPase [Patescibacteria group bacterium]
MKTIEIENLGAIKHVSIPYPEGGGLVVLKGPQGAGKSTALSAIDALCGKSASLEKRDGAISGSVSGLGVTITVKKSARRTGELEVESIEGRFSIADLVDPKIADPLAADAKRIKALVQLAGAESDQALFYDLVGGQAEFLRIVGDQSKEKDLLKLAGVVKKKIEATAREIESSADAEAGKARAYRESAAAAPAEEAIDPATLQADLEA